MLLLVRDLQPDWVLVDERLGRRVARVLQSDQTMLVTYAGVLARYERMDLLERLRDKVGRRDGIPGLWLLLPGQRTTIPESWLQNVHRGERA